MPNEVPVQAEATIIEIHEETPTVKTFLLDLAGVPFQFFPGQWVDFYIETAAGLQIGGFSITSSPTVEGTIELAVKRLSYGIPAQYLHDEARIGDSFHIDGGSGKFYYQKSKGGPLLLIAGGIGITPIISIARYVADNRLDIDMNILYSAATPSEFAFKSTIEEIIASSPRFNCLFTTTKDSSEGWTGRTGRIDSDLLRQYVSMAEDPLIYLCGPQLMTDDLKQALMDINVRESRINAERWW
jgi:ferredoxin-NADP reductase